jgi:hypothetical protein
MARQRRRFDIFSMSFLDTICCAFGAIVLLYMVLNAATGRESDRRTASARADANKIEVEVLEGYQNLVAMTNALRSATNAEVTAQGQSARVIEELDTTRQQLAEYTKETLSRREHINQLKADLKSLDEANRRLEAGSRSSGAVGNKVVGFRGDGDRQYLTGLKLRGRHTLILVDSSASMLDETLVNVIRIRNMSEANRRAAGKWRKTVATVEWLMSQLGGDAQFQIYGFNTTAWPLVAGSEGKWLSTKDADALSGSITALRALVPKNGTSLDNAFEIVNALTPKPDSVVILTDGLPTQGSGGPGLRKTIDSDGRMKLFDRAISRYPSRIPLNIVLFPMEGDPQAAGAFWRAAQHTQGAFLVPAKDWP